MSDPIDPKYVEQMNDLAKTLDRAFNGNLRGADREVGFVLIVFKFNATDRSNYISNAQRSDVVEMLRSQADHLEKEVS